MLNSVLGHSVWFVSRFNYLFRFVTTGQIGLAYKKKQGLVLGLVTIFKKGFTRITSWNRPKTGAYIKCTWCLRLQCHATRIIGDELGSSYHEFFSFVENLIECSRAISQKNDLTVSCLSLSCTSVRVPAIVDAVL